jgi:cobalt transport protein ATP-binding subunit
VIARAAVEPHIRVDRVSFAYPDGQPALHEVSFTAAPGEKVALVGPNGSGKSTLLLHLNGILRPVAGSVAICGLPLNDATVKQIRGWVGLLFQDPDDQLFSPRVYDDIAFASRYLGLSEGEVRQRVLRALDLVGMMAYVDRVPYHLSLGEKKRIALATILTTDTRILLLDEPTAGLDPRGRRELIALLETFTETTMLISTHDMRLAARLCSRAIVLDAGAIVADGAAETILYDRQLMERHGLETPA